MRERMPNGNLIFSFLSGIVEISAYNKITQVDYDYIMNLVNSYNCDFYTFFIELPEGNSLKIQLYQDSNKENIIFLKTRELAIITKDSAAVRKIDKKQAIQYIEIYLKLLII